MLIPGFTGSKEDFLPILEPLAQFGWSVVSYDQRGQFESRGPEDESAYTLAALATELHEVIAAISTEPVHVIGHSFGGLVAREAALNDGPEDFASLILLCSGAGPLPPSHHDSLGALRAALPQVPLEMVWEVKDAADREGGWVPPNDEIAEFMRRRFIANNAYALRAKATTLMETPDRTSELASLARAGLSVAVMHGADDDAWPLAEQDLMAKELGTNVVVIPNTAHSPAVEAPASTAAAINLLLSGVKSAHRG